MANMPDPTYLLPVDDDPAVFVFADGDMLAPLLVEVTPYIHRTFAEIVADLDRQRSMAMNRYLWGTLTIVQFLMQEDELQWQYEQYEYDAYVGDVMNMR